MADFVIHRDGFVTQAGEVVGRCVTDEDGDTVVEYFDPAFPVPEKAWFRISNT